LAAAKRLLWDGVGRSVESALPDESRTVSELSGTHDAREGLAAVIERRAPHFEGR
jgi:2-(1,2-epoxy-1,2-dihydrophenyl)acetyl-CoA isomerase